MYYRPLESHAEMNPQEDAESMEVGHGTQASSDLVSAVQCMDTKTVSSERSIYFNIYDKKRIGDKQAINKTIAFRVEQNCSSHRKYKVYDPIGWGLLMCRESDCGRNYSSLSPAVSKDVDSMKGALKKNGNWNTTTIKNLTRRKLRQELCDLETRGPDLLKYSVFMLYYTGHGTSQGIVLENESIFAYLEIMTKIEQIPELRDKPKIFIFDCCRTTKSGENRNNFNKELAAIYGAKDFPKHTMVCFSALECCSSYLHKEEGSLYTANLTHTLKQFGRRLSFSEIITQVNGGTSLLADQVLHRQLHQRPIFQSTFEQCLVLNVNSDEIDEIERDGVLQLELCAIHQESQHQAGGEELVAKGYMKQCEGERDIVHKLKAVEGKSQWRSRKLVEDSVGVLGDGISVFFIYAPNPEDAYKKSPDDSLEQRNKYLMCLLFLELQNHGFHVVSDLHLGDVEPSNWLQWYITRINQCNVVIFVCSPAFKTLFQEEVPSVEKISDDRSKRLLEYRNAIYASLARELSGGGKERRRFLPVILDSKYSEEESVPSLLQAGKVFRIKQEQHGPRKFDYDNRERDFEKLVCYMAEIDRLEIDKTPLGRVVPLGPSRVPFEMDDGGGRRSLDEPPPGFVRADEFRPLPSLLQSSSSVTPATSFTNLPSSHHITSPLFIPDPAVHPRVQQAYPQGHQTYPQVQHPQGHQPYPQMQQAYPQGHQAYPQVQHPQGHQAYPQVQHPQGHQAYPQVQQAYPQAQHLPEAIPPPPAPSSLPNNPPNSRIYLWLAGQLMSWKFVARHLGITEPDIVRIQEDYHGITEHRYQMFLAWERYFYEECSYQKLGEVLLRSDANRHLYEEYVKRVREIEK